MRVSASLKDAIKIYLDFIYATLLWFFASFLGILLSLGSATVAFYRVMASLIQPQKQTYIFQTFITEFKQHFMKRLLLTVLFYVDVFGLFVIFEWALRENRIGLMVAVGIIVYETVMGLIYYFGMQALFEMKPGQSLLTTVVIAMHQNLWRNLQLISPLFIMVFAIIYIHPATFIFLSSLAIGLQLIILKRAFLKASPLPDEV